MDRLNLLAVAAAAWFVLHAGVSGSPLRWRIVERIGERAFRGVFSLLSVGSLAFLIWSYGRAPCSPLWIPPRALLYLPIVIMPVAFVLLAGAFTVKNPGSVGSEGTLGGAEPARGVLRITRHPFLWGVAVWSGVHALVNANVASLLFFGSLCSTALLGTRDIDRKRRRTHPELWGKYERVTSNVPFAAIASRRNQLSLRELTVPVVLGVALTALLLLFHREWFHVRPLP
ncbi:MAG TPA: NnrU family protein [Polyangiaceae bacterium]